MGKIARLTDDHVIYTFSAKNAPAIEVDSGTTLIVETRDAYDQQFAEGADIERYLRERHTRHTNPATGPVYVRGAVLGDGLSVTIDAIDLAPTGYVAAVPGIGVLGDTEIEPRISRFHVQDDVLWYESAVRLRLRPMVGVIGVAPRMDDIPCVELGYHGGNLDFNDITVGTRCHFPVAVEGGLLALGDIHASMGFGEVHSGVNIDATVRITVERVPDAGWARPWFETATEVMVFGVEQELVDAIREATLGMVRLLQRRLGVSYTEAIVLAGAAADMRMGQASRFGTKVSAYTSFPKSAL